MTTATRAFGVSGREGHDATAFYGTEMMKGVALLPNDERLGKLVPAEGDWFNQMYCHSSEDMRHVPDSTIGLAFTSPPYNVGKIYDENLSLSEWKQLLSDTAEQVWKKLAPGGRYVVNVANVGRKPYLSLSRVVHEVHTDWHGFACQGEIIWQKAKGAGGNCAWGSWRKASAPSLRDIHEYLIVFTKGRFGRPDEGISDIGRDEFMEATLSIWNIPPASAKRIGHPAPFPEALAERVIKLYSYVGDVILDPFAGSGTTCVAAKRLGRKYVGYDIDQGYVDLANRRIDLVQ